MRQGSIVTVILIFITALVLIGGAYYVFGNKSVAEKSLESVSSKISGPVSSPSPTPFAFQELTIPYLRSRSYSSKLGELRKYSSGVNYSSYLTDYVSDGLKINGLLTIPTGNVPDGGFPAIVFVHGYIAPSVYKTTERYSDYVDYLARNGFVVFKIDLRGNGDSQGEPSGAYYSGDYIIDTLNAYSALENADFINPKRIGIWGHSMAGNVTFRSFIVKKNIPALVIWAGAGYTYEDLREFRIMDNSYRAPAETSVTAKKRQELRTLHGEFDPNDSFWRQVVPTNYLGGVTGAIQLDHAVDDDVVSIEYSRNLDKILGSTAISHELKEYSSGGHNITGSSFVVAMQNTVEFFRKNLQ